MNNITIVGNVAKLGELETRGQDATSFYSFTVAVDPNSGRDGHTSFFTIETWGQTAEAQAAHLTKGRQVSIAGAMVQSHWENEHGKQSRWYIEPKNIEWLGTKN